MKDELAHTAITDQLLDEKDKRRLIIARLTGMIGALFIVSGVTAVLVSNYDLKSRASETMFLLFVVGGLVAVYLSEKTFRFLMKKYLRQFSIIDNKSR